jgi:hypothetical protein
MSKLWGLAALLAMFVVAGAANAAHVKYIDGHAMMPLNALKESFGASIQYDSRSRGYDISLDYQRASITPGYRTARIGDRTKTLEANVVLINGTVYVPVGFMSMAFGYNTNWLDSKRQMAFFHPRTRQRVLLAVECDQPARRAVRKPGVSLLLQLAFRNRDRGHDCDHHDYGRYERKHDKRYDRDCDDSRYDGRGKGQWEKGRGRR